MKVSAECSARIANASLVAAVAVVLLHLCLAGPAAEGSPVRLFVRDFARFAVPFFFLVSGFLIAGHAAEPGWWARETLKRVRSLLVPYVGWSALFGLYLLVGVAVPELHRTHGFDVVAWWRKKELLLFGLDLRQMPLMLPLWYLRTLFLLVLVSGVLVRAVRRWGMATLFGFGAVYLAYAVSVDWRPDLTVTTVGSLLRATFAPEAFFCFVAGLWLRLNGLEPKPRKAVPFLAVAAVLLVVRQLVGPWLPYPVVLPFVIYGVWCAVPATPWPKALTALSFPIYLLHWFFIHTVSNVCSERGASIGALLLAFVGVLAAAVLLVRLLKHCFPRLANLLFGGR